MSYAIHIMAQHFIEAAQAAQAEGKMQRARRLLANAVREYPDDPLAWWHLYLALDDPAQKLECLRHVVRLDPDNRRVKDELRKLEATVASTAADHQRNVYDSVETDDGVLIIAPERDNTIVESSNSDVAVLIASVAIALIAIAATVMLVLTGTASDVLGFRPPDEAPTAIPLVFGTPACSPSSDNRTLLVFINNTQASIRLTSDSHTQSPWTIDPGDQLVVEVPADESVTYQAETLTDVVSIGSAVFEVAAGTACRVPIE